MEIWNIFTTLVTVVCIAVLSLEVGYELGRQDEKEQARHGKQ